MDHLLSKDFLGKSRPEGVAASPNSGRPARPHRRRPPGSMVQPSRRLPSGVQQQVSRQTRRDRSDWMMSDPLDAGRGRGSHTPRPHPLASGQSGPWRGANRAGAGDRPGPGASRSRFRCSLTIRWLVTQSKTTRRRGVVVPRPRRGPARVPGEDAGRMISSRSSGHGIESPQQWTLTDSEIVTRTTGASRRETPRPLEVTGRDRPGRCVGRRHPERSGRRGAAAGSAWSSS